LLHYPNEWAAFKLKDLELVVCEVRQMRRTGQSPVYEDSMLQRQSIPLEIEERTVTIRAATTGEIVAERKFIAKSEPPSSVMFLLERERLVVSRHVEADPVVTWVKQYVDP
jgi:hypothetical protein